MFYEVAISQPKSGKKEISAIRGTPGEYTRHLLCDLSCRLQL